MSGRSHGLLFPRFLNLQHIGGYTHATVQKPLISRIFHFKFILWRFFTFISIYIKVKQKPLKQPISSQSTRMEKEQI